MISSVVFYQIVISQLIVTEFLNHLNFQGSRRTGSEMVPNHWNSELDFQQLHGAAPSIVLEIIAHCFHAIRARCLW